MAGLEELVMILVTYSWHARAIMLFVAQLEERQIEPVAHAIAFQHGLTRMDIAVTYKGA